MADVSEISKMSSKELKQVQGAIAMFHILGLTDDDIKSLVVMAKQWETIVSNMNAFSNELIAIKRKIGSGKGENGGSDAPEDYKDLVGFDSHSELIIPKGAKER